MIYKNENITVECNDTLVTIKKGDVMLKGEAYSNYNEAEDKFKEICKQVDEYLKKKK